MKVSVSGDKDLIEALSRLRKTGAKAAVRKGSRAASKLVQAQARADVPVRTGVLRRELKVRALPRSRRWTGTQVTARVADGPAYYGAFVELGTKKMEGRHFIKRAVEQKQTVATAAFTRGIADEILVQIAKGK